MDDIYAIISLVSKWTNREIVIGNIEHQILQLLAERPYSIYKIMSYFKNTNRPMDYKNAFRRAQKIIKLELIQEIESAKSESTHGAIFYRLSEFGLYYLIRNTRSSLVLHLTLTQLFKLVLKSYKDNILFSTVLYPYFEISTLLNLCGTLQIGAIWQYLRACCEQIEKAIGTVNKTQPGGTQIFIWNDISPGQAREFRNLDDTRLGEYLKRELKLNWLDRAEIRKFEDDKNLNISSGNNSVLISLSENKRTAILKINRKQVKKLNVTLLPLKDGSLFVWTINVPDISMHQYATLFLSASTKQLASQLVFGIVSKGLIESDIKALASDKKFTKLVRSTQKDFNKACKLITV